MSRRVLYDHIRRVLNDRVQVGFSFFSVSGSSLNRHIQVSLIFLLSFYFSMKLTHVHRLKYVSLNRKITSI